MKIDRLKKPDLSKVEAAAKALLESLNIDVTCPDVRNTYGRIARMLVDELLAGHYTDPPKMTVFPKNSYSGMVALRDITVRSLCSHHMLPFFGKAHIAYIPGEKVVGISKFSRIARYYSSRLQTQENLTSQIAAHIDRELKPRGVIVYVEATHMCMHLRGAREHDSRMVTCSCSGEFEKEAVKEQFFKLIK